MIFLENSHKNREIAFYREGRRVEIHNAINTPLPLLVWWGPKVPRGVFGMKITVRIVCILRFVKNQFVYGFDIFQQLETLPLTHENQNLLV